MMDKIAQVGLMLTGFLGMIGAVEGLSNNNAALFAAGLLGASVSFLGLLIVFLLSYRDLSK